MSLGAASCPDSCFSHCFPFSTGMDIRIDKKTQVYLWENLNNLNMSLAYYIDNGKWLSFVEWTTPKNLLH